MIPSIPALQQRADALVAQAKTLNPKTMTRAEKDLFLAPVDEVVNTINQILPSINKTYEFATQKLAINYSQHQQNHPGCTFEQYVKENETSFSDGRYKCTSQEYLQHLRDHGTLCKISLTLRNATMLFGTWMLNFNPMQRRAITKTPVRLDYMGTVKDLKAAAALILKIPPNP